MDANAGFAAAPSLQALLDACFATHAAADSATVPTLTLAAGTYLAGISLDRSVHIVGIDAVLVAPPGQPVLRVDADGLDVTLVGLTLRDAAAEVGAGLTLRGFSTVTLQGCTVLACRARQAPGDALYADAGTLLLRNCAIGGLDTERGASLALVQVSGVATLRAEDCAFSGDAEVVVLVREEADVELLRCSVRQRGVGAAVDVAGTRSQRPSVVLLDCTVVGEPALALASQFPGRVRSGGCRVEGGVKGVVGPWREPASDGDAAAD